MTPLKPLELVSLDSEGLPWAHSKAQAPSPAHPLPTYCHRPLHPAGSPTPGLFFHISHVPLGPLLL